jgi:hypothetical protein
MDVAGRGKGPGSSIAGSVRGKIPVGGSGFAGTFRDSAFNGYEYGTPPAMGDMFNAMEPKTNKVLTGHRLASVIKQRQGKEAAKSDLQRLLDSASAPDLKTVSLKFDWQDEFQQKDFLIPPNNTGYRPLWTFDFGRPTVDLRKVKLEPRWNPKIESKFGEDPFWQGPDRDDRKLLRTSARPLSPSERSVRSTVSVNLPPL